MKNIGSKAGATTAVMVALGLAAGVGPAQAAPQQSPGVHLSSVVVDPANKFLYLVQPDGKSLRYGIGVGKAGFAWAGEAEIHDKQHWPKWFPPPEMQARETFQKLPAMAKLKVWVHGMKTAQTPNASACRSGRRR